MEITYLSADWQVVPKEQAVLAKIVDGDDVSFEQMPQTGAQQKATGFFVIPRNVSKDDGKWITTAGGQHIKIEDKPVQQPKSPQQQAVDKSGISADNPYATHIQREEAVRQIVKELGSKNNIKVSKTPSKEDPEIMGLCKRNSKTDEFDITIYPEAFQNEEELRGTVAHEDMHATFGKVLRDYNDQKVDVLYNGMPANHEQAETYRDMKSLFTDTATYALAGGVTKYSQMYWDEYGKNKEFGSYLMAVNETIAECHRLESVGKGDQVQGQWRAVYNRVKRLGAKESKRWERKQ